MRKTTWLLVLCSSAFLIAQQPKTFKDTAGAGADRRVDAGDDCRIRIGFGCADRHEADHYGTFEGLRSPATIAQLHKQSGQGRSRPGDLRPRRAKPDGTSGTHQRHARSDAHSGRRPRKGPALRAAAQRESPGRQSLGLAAAAGEQAMRRPPFCRRRAAASPRRWRIALRRAASSRRAARLHGRAGDRRARGLPGELRELSPARSRGTQRSAAAGRRQLHEHVARRARRATCSSSSRRRCRRRARTSAPINTSR